MISYTKRKRPATVATAGRWVCRSSDAATFKVCHKNRLQFLLCSFAPLLLCAFALSLPAAQLKLAWDPSPSPGVTNYVLYVSTNAITVTNAQPVAARISVGTNLTSAVEFLRAGRWHFAATAQAEGVESEYSNELIVQVPEPATNLRTLVIEYTLDLTGSTNWSQLGFLRLKLP